MILTVTPNPSLDRAFELPELARGAVLRATGDRVDPGGKGVNVSRALAAAGHQTAAVVPLGGAEGALLARLLGELDIEAAGVPVAGSTRVNVTLVEPDGTLTKVNASGPRLDAAAGEALLEAVRARSGAARWIAACGSLPRGLGPEWYAALVALAHRAGVPVALDTSGEGLRAALRERPELVKPNAEELAEAVGRPLATVGDAVKACEELRARGAGTVLASLGAAGQLLVGAAGTHYGNARVRAVRSNVGAGDASLAGFLAAGGVGPAALTASVAHGAAAVGLPGSAMPTPADLDTAAVTTTTDVPVDRALSEAAP